MATLLFVSPTGSDSWSGRIPDRNPAGTDGPFATLERARDAIRAMRASAGLPAGGVHVVLREGDYFRTGPFELGPEDSGTSRAPIRYVAAPRERVRLIGGRALAGFRPVADPAVLARLPPASRPHVLELDLRALGIADFGTYAPRGHGGGSALAALELFFDREPMTVAQWPKHSPLPNREFDRIAEVRGDRLVYTDDRPARWASHADVFLHGYFTLDWASTIARMVSIDAARKEITLDPPRAGHYGMRAGGRFHYFHVLDELSAPGEWYLDWTTGLLYFWPPAEPASGEALVSTLTDPLLRMQDVAHVSFEGLTLECTRGDGVTIDGGADLAIAGCELRNIGRDAVRIRGGLRHAVAGCEISRTGECGVRIEAGDRRTLTPCRHRVHNCHIHHIARGGWTYFGAVHIWMSCGVTVTHNRVHDHRHALLFFKGNDTTIAFNEFYNSTLESDDAGCFITGRDFTFQGNRILHNHIHHGGASGNWSSCTYGVMLDDCAGGTEFEGNVFERIDRAVFAGGGINSRAVNNVFVTCTPAVWFDERGASCRADHGERMVHVFMKEQFYAVKANEPPYATRYPHLDMVHDALQRGTGVLAKGGCVARNIVVGSEGPWLFTHWTEFPDYFEFHDNLVGEDPGFEDHALGIYALRPDSPAFARIGFAPIRFREMGLVRDALRPAIADVRTALEVVRPIGADGQPGRARLRIRNDGDVRASGVELVEFRLKRHGPGPAWVEVAYDVPPGHEAAYEFDVALPSALLQGCFDVYLIGRGHDIRPAWGAMPVAYSLDSRVEVLRPPVAGRRPAPGRVRLVVRHVGTDPVDQPIRVIAHPDGATVSGNGSVPCRLEPGQELVSEIDVDIPAAGGTEATPPVSRVVLTTAGANLKPGRGDAIVEYPLPLLPDGVEPADLDRALADEPAYPVAGVPLRAESGHIADVRLGVTAGAFALAGVVRDANVMATEMIWDGSCIEVFGCSPDRERLRGRFDEIPIGQVYLVPAAGDAPARAFRAVGQEAPPAPEIRFETEPAPDGYRFRALIPFGLLAVNPESRRFLFEIQVTTGLDADKRQRRANLFGSLAAYQESDRYAMAVF